ncbi:MAG: lipid-A-disaccharide synthase [Bdellovibrionales bacterium]|nr:lipid-A-disaccharide synthase [Bdellovibrionales bacterium]
MAVSAAAPLPRSGPRQEVLIVTGEVSGDEHAAPLVRTLNGLMPGVHCFGMGGARLRDAGMECLVDSERVAGVMGLTEVLGSLGGLVGAFRRLVRAAEERRPALAILVDFAEFNMLLARALQRRGIRVMYYISPQLWAWRRGRIHTIRRVVEHVVTIFPFEADFYERHGVPATYVGHPFLDRPPLQTSRTDFLAECGIAEGTRTIGLLPGSRRKEVSALLPDMLGGLTELRNTIPGLQGIIPVADSLDFDWMRELTAGCEGVHLVRGRAREVLGAVDASVVASGTATVEAALAGAPFLVVYRVTPVTYVVGKLLVKGVKNFAMVNVIAGREVVPELLQHQVSGARIASELTPLLLDSERRGEVQAALRQVNEQLRYRGDLDGTSSERAARVAMSLLRDEDG